MADQGTGPRPEPKRTDQTDETRRRGIAAYQGALEAVFAIAIGAGLGFWADQRFGSEPLWLIVGIGIGFGAFVLRLWRMRGLFEDVPPSGPRDRG